MLLKLLCVVSLLTYLGTGVDATCGSTLSTYLTRTDIVSNSTLEYLYVSSPYSVSVVSGNEFAVVWNGTDAGDVENLIVAGQSANITLIDSTTTAGLAPRSPRKAVSTADRSPVGQTINVLALVLSFGAIQYSRKGLAPLFVVIIALSMVNLISSTVFSNAPCPDATITLQIPEATIRFICVNNEPCVCGPGYSGNDCTIGSAPVATPISNPPSAAPVNPPMTPPMAPPVAPPVAAPSCNDTIKNGLETDVDCGGGTCPKCVPNQHCSINNDCDSSICSGNVCQQPTCSDATKNGLETDKDCGGTQCPKCAVGNGCLLDRDCSTSVCTNNICQQASCTDNTLNGNETDVDCGGGTCPGCLLNQTCQAGRDCASGLSCDSLAGKCIDACKDGVKNNQETDVDCGGSTCSQRCIAGQSCNIGSDCTSGQCNMYFKCLAPPSA